MIDILEKIYHLLIYITAPNHLINNNNNNNNNTNNTTNTNTIKLMN